MEAESLLAVRVAHLPPHGWWGTNDMHSFLPDSGFTPSAADPCVHITSAGGAVLLLLFCTWVTFFFVLTRLDELVVVLLQVIEQLNDGAARDRRSRRCSFLLGMGIELK